MAQLGGPLGTGEPVQVGLVGAGSASRAYLRNLDDLVSSGDAVAGPVHDRNPARRAELLARRPASVIVDSLEDVLDSDVSLVVITTPPASHAELARRALQAGKHVLVEKPLADDMDEAVALVRRAEDCERLLVVAPFVQLSPSFVMLFDAIRAGVIGAVHSARGMYGNTGSNWASWYHTAGVGPLGDLAVYNIKSLAVLLGPIETVQAWSTTSSMPRELPDGAHATDPDTVHLILRHAAGAMSTVMASHAVWAYRRPALELYGTEGTANLLGDDWDPEGIEIMRGDWGHWRLFSSPDRTWNWTDGLRTAVHALRTGDTAGLSNALDLHVLDVICAARDSASVDGAAVRVTSTFAEFPLPDIPTSVTHVHDRTRPITEQ